MTNSNPFDAFYNLNDETTQMGNNRYRFNQNLGQNSNVFDQYYQAEAKQKDQKLKLLLESVAQNDPNLVGEAQRLADQLNLPDEMILDSTASLDYLRNEARRQNIRARELSMLNPVLARQLEDPNFAAIAHDNIPRLAQNESLWETITSIPQDGWQGLHKGHLSREMGLLANRLMYRGVEIIDLETGFDPNYVPTEQDIKDFERLKEISDTIQKYDADGVGLIEATAYFAGQWGSAIPEAALTGLATWKASTWLGTKIGTAAGFFIPDGPLLIGGEMAGAFVGGTIGNFVGMFTGWNAFSNKLALDTQLVESGHSWLELRESGYTMNEAFWRANAVGTANFAIERYGLSFIGPRYLKALPGLKDMFVRSGLAKIFKNRFSREITKNALSRSGKKLTYNFVTRQFLQDWVVVVGTETGQELAQEMVAIAGVNLFADMSQEEIETISAEELGSRIFSTLTETMKGMVLFGLIGPGITYRTNLNKAIKARDTTSVLEKLAQISKDDKTKLRNSKAFQEYEQALADKSGISDFYFDVNTFRQELDNNQITEEQLEMFSSDVVRQLEDATKEGTVGKLVKIPAGKYISEISGTNLGNALFPHLKIGENEYSQTEMNQFFQDQPQLLADAKALMNERKQELLKFQSESKAVKRQIAKQLRDIGYREKDARDMAELPQAFADTYSKALGITPLQFLNQFQYNIQKDTRDRKTFSNQFFNQDGTIKTETQLFKNWFRKSKLTNPDGTPQVMYHGTIDSFDYFDLDHPNRYDTGFAGTGVYLTPDKRLAERYARQKSVRTKAKAKDRKVMALYARLENPKIEDLRKLKYDIKQGGRTAADNYRNKLMAEGHDGVILKNEAGEVVEVVVFDVNGVKSVDNNGNWSNEINNIYEQQALEIFEQKATQKQGKPVPQAVFQMANIVENFDFAKSKPFKTNRDFKLEIQNRVKKEAKKGGVDVSKFTAEVEKYLVQTLLADANYALVENPNAIGWYNEKVTKAVRLLSLVYPKLATDTRHGFIFKWALATTSNGIKVDKNFEYAADVYEKWLRSEEELGEGKGRLPELMLNELGEETGGESRVAMEKSFRRLNDLLDKKPFKELEEFMKTKHTVKEITEFVGKDRDGIQIKVPSDFSMGDIVYGSSIIGPKIGNGFFANLYGNYEQLTVDRWAMRTWGRMTGTLVLDRERLAKQKRQNIKSIIRALTKEQKKAFEALIGRKLTLGDIDNVALAIKNKSAGKGIPTQMGLIATFAEDQKNYDTFIEIMGQPRKGDKTTSLGDLLRKQGNGLAKDNDGQKETPSGPVERRNMVKVFSQVLEALQRQNPNLTMADLQALVWYPEKKLYDSAKLKEAVVETGYEDNEAPDYANAAAGFVATMGISDDLIQSTIKEVDNELQSDEQSTGIQRDDEGRGDSVGVGKTFQQQGKIDEATGLPLNPDGTVTVYHHTDRKSAERIKATSELRSAGEPNVYVTTRAIADTGYGDTAVAIRIDPSRLSLDDEFPNGRRDFRLSVGTPGGSVQVKTGEFFEQQASEGPRGRFDPTTLTTLLTEKADFSTFAHETAHYMLTVLENIVATDTAPPDLIADFDTLLNFWGVKDLETWQSFDLNQKREYHEAFAYNFEQYLFDKKAPSKGLKDLFRKFARFIKKVYQDVSTRLNELYKRETGKDLPILTDEVRSVMDRMLATDEQIIQAEQIYDLKAMFQTQEQSGMNDAEWAEYTRALQEAEDETLEIMTLDSMKQVRWVRKKMPKIQEEIDKKINKLYKQEKAIATKEILQNKRYKVQMFLKRGETVNDKGEVIKVQGQHKISKSSLERLLPFYDEAALNAEIKELGTGQYGMVAKEGLDVNLVADMFDFPDALSMIDALLTLQPIDEAITERTEQRMLEIHSDLVNPRQQELQIINAIHSEARARFVAVELNTLAKAMRPVRFQVEAARQVAQDILADKKISEIRPSEFTRAEARALKETEVAMKRKDEDSIKDAIKAKRSQLINNQLAKESIEIIKEYNTAIKKYKNNFFKKSDKKLTKKGKYQRETDLIDAGRVILSSYGLGPTVEDSNVYIENLRKYDPDLYTELEPMILNARASKSKQSLKDLTYEEFQTFNDLIDSLWYQSLRVNQIRVEGKLIDKQIAVDKLNNRQDEIIERSKKLRERRDTPEGTTEAVPNTFLYNLNNFFLETGAKLRRMEPWVDMMDGASNLKKGTGSAVLELEGGKLGDFYNLLWYPMKSTLDQYRQAQTIFTKEYSDLVNSVDFGKETIVANEFAMVSESSKAYKFGSQSGGRGKVELLGAMLHTGNDSNLTKLLLGRGWGKLNEDGSLDRTHWDAFETRMKNEGILTKNDYDFIQAVWDLNEKMLPLLQKAHKETEGYYFKVQKARPILNRFGEYRGGYVPAKGDPNMTKVELKEEITAMKMEFKNSLPKVKDGMTKQRVETFYQPLSLHLGFMTKHIDDTLRYSYVQPVLNDILKIVNDKDFTKKLKIIDPFIKDEMIIPYLQSAASQKTYSPSGFGTKFDRVIQTQKRRGGIAIMFANVSNALQQLTGLFPALIKVKPRHLKNGLFKYMKDREGVNQMIAKASPFMADRQQNLIFDIQDRLNELIINPNKFEKAREWGKHHGYFLQQTFQGVVDSIVWIGTYNQVHEDMSSNTSDAEIMKEAIKQADANVRMTQDSLLPEDRAAFQNMNPIIQSMLQFSGYFNMIANLSFTQYQKLAKDDLGFKNKGKGTEQAFYMFLYTVIMPAIVAGIIMRGVGGRIEDENDDGYIFDDIAKAAFGDVADYTAGLIPVAGQLAFLPINQFNDKPWDDDIVSSPSIEMLQDSARVVLNLPKTIVTEGLEGVTGKQIRDSFTMFNQIFGLPVTPIGRTWGYFRDVQRGDVTPKGPLDFLRGLITGKKGTGK